MEIVAVVERAYGADHEHGDDEADVVLDGHEGEHGDDDAGDDAEAADEGLGNGVDFTDAVGVIDEAELFGVAQQQEDGGVGCC